MLISGKRLTTPIIAIGPPNSIQRILLSLRVQKNTLSFNNLVCQTFTSRLYNLKYILDYIIYKLK
jgi:hypothetical protein